MVENTNKTKLITPMITLIGAAISVVIMYIRDYEFYKMLWCLFAVIIIFFIIGDIIQCIYARIRPKVIPESENIQKLLNKTYGVNGLDYVSDEKLQEYMAAADALDDFEDEDMAAFLSGVKAQDEEGENQPADMEATDFDTNGFDEDYQYDDGSFMDENDTFN